LGNNQIFLERRNRNTFNTKKMNQLRQRINDCVAQFQEGFYIVVDESTNTVCEMFQFMKPDEDDSFFVLLGEDGTYDTEAVARMIDQIHGHADRFKVMFMNNIIVPFLDESTSDLVGIQDCY
jgi:hypothetical protein